MCPSGYPAPVPRPVSATTHRAPPRPPHAPSCQSRCRVVSHPLPLGLGSHTLPSHLLTPRGVSLPIFECDFKEWKMRLCVFIKKMVPDSLAVSDSFVPSDHFQPLLGWGLRGEGLGGASSPPPTQQASRASLSRVGWGEPTPPLLPHHSFLLPGGQGQRSLLPTAQGSRRRCLQFGAWYHICTEHPGLPGT